MLDLTIPKTGIYKIGREYYQIDRLSHSMLKNIDKSPLAFQHERTTTRAASDAQNLGSYVHGLILEPENIERDFAISLKYDKRTKTGKEAAEAFAEENSGKVIISLEQEKTGREMADAVLQHPAARRLLGVVEDTEVSILFQRGGVDCKARLDATTHRGMLLDIKTTSDLADFARSVEKYSYHTQAEWYLDAANRAGIEADAFVFIAVENSAPYDVACFSLADDWLEIAQTRNEQRLDRYVEALASGQWRGLSDTIVELQAPAWLKKL